jgi:hypothetical protein
MGRLKAAPTYKRRTAQLTNPGPANARHRFWWEFHQGVVSLVYAGMAFPAWYARGLIGGWQGRAFFIVFLAAIVVSVTARLHLWFTSRFYPGSSNGCTAIEHLDSHR